MTKFVSKEIEMELMSSIIFRALLITMFFFNIIGIADEELFKKMTLGRGKSGLRNKIPQIKEGLKGTTREHYRKIIKLISFRKNKNIYFLRNE